uniref:Uncharacterized protein n=1 Tax=Anguilla anguilla TaxID=7936 RepID=A0A0E9QY52_ANGAN
MNQHTRQQHNPYCTQDNPFKAFHQLIGYHAADTAHRHPCKMPSLLSSKVKGHTLRAVNKSATER